MFPTDSRREPGITHGLRVSWLPDSLSPDRWGPTSNGSNSPAISKGIAFFLFNRPAPSPWEFFPYTLPTVFQCSKISALFGLSDLTHTTMKSYTPFFLLFAAYFWACQGPATVQPRTAKPQTLIQSVDLAGFSAARLARIDQWLEASIAKGDLPNAVTFIARKGQIVHHKAFGFKDLGTKDPVAVHTIFRMASQTKAITTVGLMMLFEEGKFLLEDPVSQYLPAFSNPRILEQYNKETGEMQTKPAKRAPTIRELLSHTAGILPYGHPLYQKEGIPELCSLEPLLLATAMDKLGQLPLLHEPGAAYTYGLNTDVCGYLIEVLSGMPLDQYFAEKIFKPLGMTDTHFYLPEEKAPRLVTLHERTSMDSPLRISDNKAWATYPVAGAKTYFSGGAGLVGTIEDYGKFCQMLLNMGSFNGVQLLSPKTMEVMLANQIGEFEVWGTQNKFGLGFELFTPAHVARHTGSVGAFKWGGAYSTDFTIDPAEDLIFLCYTNALPFANPNWHMHFRALVYQALVEE